MKRTNWVEAGNLYNLVVQTLREAGFAQATSDGHYTTSTGFMVTVSPNQAEACVVYRTPVPRPMNDTSLAKSEQDRRRLLRQWQEVLRTTLGTSWRVEDHTSTG